MLLEIGHHTITHQAMETLFTVCFDCINNKLTHGKSETKAPFHITVTSLQFILP